MKRITIIIVAGLVFAFVALALFVLLQPSSRTLQVGPDTVFIGSDAIPFHEAVPRLEQMLNGSLENQIIALSALVDHAPRTLETPLLPRILAIATQNVDYSALDQAFARLGPNATEEDLNDPILINLGELARVQELALFLAVVNGSPQALQTLARLESSGSFTQNRIATMSSRWVSLHGTPANPKPQPLVYGSRTLPFDDFVATAASDILSGLPAQQNAAAGYVATSLQRGKVDDASRDQLVELLKSYLDLTDKEKMERPVETEREIIAASAIAGGQSSKEILVRLSKSDKSAVSNFANECLANFAVLHPGDE